MLKNWEFDKADVADLRQRAAPKQPNLNKLGDASGLKDANVGEVKNQFLSYFCI